MTSYADAVNELNQNTNELRTMLCNVAANQKKLKYASSQFESFNRKFKETHSGEGTFERNEMLALKGIITQITKLKSIIANNFSQQWAQNTIGNTSNSIASDICKIIFESNEAAQKIDPENAPIFDSKNSNWLKYHLLDLRTIATSFNNFLDKRKTEDQVSTAIKARLKSINKFIEEYKDETLYFEDTAFSVIPIHYRTWKLDQNDFLFEKKDLVGSGASARVFKGVMKESGIEVAIKQLKSKELKGGKFRSFQREVSILAMVDHPTILKFIGATDTFPYSIVTEWMDGGDLYKALKKHKLDGTQLTICALDIARGMNYLHQKMIVHRDLKSLNILLDKDGHSRICDLGFARVVEETSKDNLKTFVGTYYWMAPELLDEDPSYTPKVDVYSYGIMLWEMLAQKVPYNGEDPTKVIAKVYKNNARPIFPSDVDKVPGMKKLIEECWERQPENRPSFKEIIGRFASGDAFYQDADVDKVLEYARKVLAEDDPDSLKTKNFIEECEKTPVTLEKFNETFQNMKIPQWYYDICWDLFQSLIPNNISDSNCNLELLAKGLEIFLDTTKFGEAMDVFKKFPENTVPEKIVNEFVESIPSGDEKLDEYYCIIACNNSKAQDALLRVFEPVPSLVVFNYISNNADKLKYDARYIDAIIARIFVPLNSVKDIETAAAALGCLDSIASYLFKQKATLTDETEKKQNQIYINKLFSDYNVAFIVTFVLNLGKSKSLKSGSKTKAVLSNISTYFQLMVSNDIPFTIKQNVFGILLSSQTNVDMIKEILSSTLESNKTTAGNFVQWLTENVQNLPADLFISLVSKLKPHKELYKDIKNVIGVAKSQSKGKTKDSLKKLEHEFN